MPANPRRANRSPSLPLDPPPFYLEREIRLTESRSGVYAFVVGVLILLAFRLLAGTPPSIPISLGRLLLVSSVTVAVYLGVRFAAYWAAWAVTVKVYPLEGGIHPAARGELPRNAYGLALLTPFVCLVTACILTIQASSGDGPEAWLVLAVGSALCVRDLRFLAHVARLDRLYWVKETPRGMDVLKPVGSRSQGAP